MYDHSAGGMIMDVNDLHLPTNPETVAHWKEFGERWDVLELQTETGRMSKRAEGFRMQAACTSCGYLIPAAFKSCPDCF